MSQLRAGFVIGFHGCDAATARAIIAGEASVRQSAEDYDWLGPGAYFWEGDARRAQEWAEAKVARGAYSEPAVVAAVIDLGHCLDLTTRDDLALLADAYTSLESGRLAAGLEMPSNRDLAKRPGDKLLRYLDCAVIKHLHENIEAEAAEALSRGERGLVRPFDTVRGLFIEGAAIYPGGGFHSLTHTQIAVRNDAAIKGVFLPRRSV